jgi:chromosome segregation ATPase
VQGKTSVLFGAISIVAVGGMLAAFAMMPPSDSQAQTDELREAINLAFRKHNKALGLLAGPNVLVDGALPPTFVKGNETNITVLSPRRQNTSIPGILDKLQSEIKSAIDKAPLAASDTKAAAYSLMGQALSAKALYHLQSAVNAAADADDALVAIDTGIVSVQQGLRNIRQIAPLTQEQETVAVKMKSAAEAEMTRLKGEITKQESAITKLETDRAGFLAAQTKHSNEASELWTLSSATERQKRRDLQEQSYVKAKLANKAGQDAEDAQAKIDTARSAVVSMNIELTSAQSAAASAGGVLTKFAGNRAQAKENLDKATLAMNTTGGEIAKKADELIAACDKVDAEQATAAAQYVAALEAMKQFRQHASDSSEAIGGQAGLLMDKAWAAVAFVSSRETVGAAGVRLKALWETAALDGAAPKAAEMTAFAGKAVAGKKAAADSFAEAAALYEKATTQAEKYKWSYQCRELRARRARHGLTGDAADETRAELLEQQLEGLKGFPYVDNAL